MGHCLQNKIKHKKRIFNKKLDFPRFELVEIKCYDVFVTVEGLEKVNFKEINEGGNLLPEREYAGKSSWSFQTILYIIYILYRYCLDFQVKMEDWI
jgi:hypothetical protein